MNKTDRLLAIVLELQRRGRQRAEDLAETFETSKRTIYRDILALCEAGVPIISVPGQGYSLMKGYFLPPLSFTAEEATMLLLGSHFMAKNFDAQYRAAAESAARKIEGVLPETLRADVQYLQSNIRFIGPINAPDTREHETLQQLRRALLDRNTIRFRYHTRHRSDEQDAFRTREADPYGLAYILSAWYLVAYCHTRQDIRNFRLDRIEELELLPRTFTRPANVQFNQSERDQERNITVRVLFDKEIARWVREGRSFYVTSEEETADGLLVTLRIRHEREILQWLLSWGSRVRIVEPASLRERMAAETRAMLRNYQPADSPITH
ncbi:helix-turn-helix transcriptional regulator [Dictyobacter kobayashii]|uniref:Transcriptional regulator n=1 Tax=Dictyobacter kobayashii TaxID=2014872 RepID=A0A402AQG1_9CHLR|nr:YafY family protein [Dictyobacter kobayashii]GCE21408.1 transcriptional regulator [Dictyobacter kobayashii]